MDFLIGSILGALIVVFITILIEGDLSFLKGGVDSSEQRALLKHSLNLEAAANAKKELSITTMSHKEIIAQTSKWLPEGSRINFNNGVLTAFDKEGNEIDHNTFGEFDEYRQNRSMVDGIITKFNVNYNIKEACESSVSYPQWEDNNTETVEVYCKDDRALSSMNRIISSCTQVLKQPNMDENLLESYVNLLEQATAQRDILLGNTKPSPVSLAKTPQVCVEVDQKIWNEIMEDL